MEIRENENICIFTPLSPKLDKRECNRLFSNIITENKKIALDMNFVQDCTIEFIENLKLISTSKEIGIFNIQSDIFALFNLMNLDKTAHLFVCETDFLENTRRLINRKFSLV
jgi:hypothetical protein